MEEKVMPTGLKNAKKSAQKKAKKRVRLISQLGPMDFLAYYMLNFDRFERMEKFNFEGVMHN